MRVSSVQLRVTGRSKEENLAHALDLVDAVEGSDLILLPEVWPSGYFSFDRYRAESEAIDGPLVDVFRSKARQLDCYILMGSFIEADGQRLFNTTLLLDRRGAIVARYRKIHLFGYRSDESRILTHGTEVVVVETPWGRCGFATCYDLRFPELFRLMVQQGAKFFLIPSAWPMVRLDAWRLFNRARAHENLAYLISCNCSGTNAGTQFAGHSMIVDPLGRIVREGEDDEELVSAQIEPRLVDNTREDFRILDDRVLG